MLGLHYAGKKSIICKLKGENILNILSNQGLGGQTLVNYDYKRLSIVLWESKERIRILWKHFLRNTDGIIFVVDSSDKDFMEDAAEELKKNLAEEELKNCCILVMANKQDRDGALSKDEITEKLGMGNLQGKNWFVESTSAITGQGLQEGLDWLLSQLLKKKKK